MIVCPYCNSRYLPNPADSNASVHITEPVVPTEFDVILTSVGRKPIQVIKEVRALTKFGLKESKDLVESAPKPVLRGVDRATAESARSLLESAGGTVIIQ